MKNTHLHYKTHKNAIILPIKNLIIDFDVHVILQELRLKLNSKYFDSKIPKIREKILQLSPNIRKVMTEFINYRTMKPIHVMRYLEINNPSLNNSYRPSVYGLDSMEIPIKLNNCEYMYQPINGSYRIALSIYFKYEYIPVVIVG
jgi:hypothetical protein